MDPLKDWKPIKTFFLVNTRGEVLASGERWIPSMKGHGYIPHHVWALQANADLIVVRHDDGSWEVFS